MSSGQVVLAHYGGAPEALTIALPAVIFVGFMALERRARRKERERAAEPAEPPGTQPAGPSPTERAP